MKDRKKQRGMKAEIRAYKKRSQYIVTVVTVAILVAIIAIASFLIYSYLKPSSNQTPTPTTQLKAAIVDHLSLTFPNQTFNQTATNTLKKAGYTVDYYPGEKVTVGFYRNLPTHDYDLIVLRVHSGLKEGKYPPLCLFTSEPYSKWEYTLEQLTDPPRLTGVAYSEEEAKMGIAYFGITPKFVQQDMKGKFQNTTIIMMGCNGLTYTYMAQAFTEKGAKVYISWSLAVSASHTDQATTRLLEHLITERQTIKQAVTETMKEVGPDPADGSILLYHPTTPEAEDYVIPEPKSNLTTNVAETNPKIERLKEL